MTISEVSKKYDISADTLRYYERIGLIPSVSRTSGGIRNYSEYDCGWVEFAKCMRGAGLPIEVLIEYVSLFVQGEATVAARKGLLVDERDKLILRILEMEKILKRLNHKIDNYEVEVVPAQSKLTATEN